MDSFSISPLKRQSWQMLCMWNFHVITSLSIGNKWVIYQNNHEAIDSLLDWFSLFGNYLQVKEPMWFFFPQVYDFRSYTYLKINNYLKINEFCSIWFWFWFSQEYCMNDVVWWRQGFCLPTWCMNGDRTLTFLLCSFYYPWYISA